MSLQEETKRIIKHEWWQVMSLGFTVVFLFLWNHAEIHSTQKETHELVNAIHDEMKDFHGRICTLEERYLNLMEKK